MRDYYEVLGVSTDASEDDVRRSYKTLALRYHPDRHTPDEQAHYSRLFQEVHDAYLVLSDPQERAWYDDHRASLLHGGRGGSGDQDSSAPPPDQMLLNLWPLFDPKCFDHQYDDAPGHFYSVYRDLFDRLWREEQRYGKQQQQQKKTPKRANHHQPPKGVSFGDSNSLYSDVSSFYRYWRQFRSVKRFGWVDQWRREHLSAAPNRQVRRAMERQNEQRRQAARKEHSDLVRRLVEFVHRRDPRVKAERERRLDEEERQQEELRKEQQRKQEIERIAAQMRERQRQQLLEEEDYDDDEDGDGDYYDDDDDGDGDDDDDEGGREGDNYHDEVDELEDIVQKYLAMERERENEKEEEEEEEGRSGTGIGKGEDVKEEDGRGSSSSNVFEFGASDGDEDDDNEDEQQQQQQSSKKKKRQKRDKKRLKRQQRSQGGGEQQHAEQQQQPQHQKEKEENDMAGTYVSGAGSRSRKRKQKQKKKKERSMMDVDHRSDDGVDDDALNADVVDHLNSAADNDSNADAGVSSSDQEPRVPSTTQHALGEDDSDLTSGTEREKEAEEEKDGDEGDLKKSKRRRRRKQQQPGNAPPLKCNVCGETFSSRNKLFQHVNELGHELAEGYSQQQRPAGAGRKGKKKK